MDEIEEKLKKHAGKYVRTSLTSTTGLIFNYSGTLEYLGNGVWKISSFSDSLLFYNSHVKTILMGTITLSI